MDDEDDKNDLPVHLILGIMYQNQYRRTAAHWWRMQCSCYTDEAEIDHHITWAGIWRLGNVTNSNSITWQWGTVQATIMDKLSGTSMGKNNFEKYITYPSQSRPPPQTMLLYNWIIMVIIETHFQTLYEGKEKYLGTRVWIIDWPKLQLFLIASACFLSRIVDVADHMDGGDQG